MEGALIILAIIFIFLIATFYAPICYENQFKPFNAFCLIPAAGIFAFAAAIMFGASAEAIAVAAIINIALFGCHVYIFYRKFESVIFAVCNYVVQFIIALLAIFSLGLALWIYLLGLVIITDGISGFFSDIFDDNQD